MYPHKQGTTSVQHQNNEEKQNREGKEENKRGLEKKQRGKETANHREKILILARESTTSQMGICLVKQIKNIFINHRNFFYS